MRRALCCAVTAAVMLGARAANAGEMAWTKVFVSPGAVFSWSTSPDTAAGAGFELSAGWVNMDAKGFWMPVVGGLWRVQGYDTGTYGSYGRHTIGLEGSLGIFGLEAGVGYRTGFGQGRFPERVGLHLSPYLTLGVLYAGPQILITDGKPEFAFNLGVKLPLPHAILLPIVIAAMSGFRGD